MPDRLRPAAYYLFLAVVIGGLWVYADLRRRIDEGRHSYLPPIDPGFVVRAETKGGSPPAGPTSRPARPGTLTDAGQFNPIGE